MKKSQRTSGENKSETNSLFVLSIIFNKGVPGGPSGPSREGPGIRHKIVSDTKKMTKKGTKKKKKEWEKGKMCNEKENGRKREKNGRK